MTMPAFSSYAGSMRASAAKRNRGTSSLPSVKNETRSAMPSRMAMRLKGSALSRPSTNSLLRS